MDDLLLITSQNYALITGSACRSTKNHSRNSEGSSRFIYCCKGNKVSCSRLYMMLIFFLLLLLQLQIVNTCDPYDLRRYSDLEIGA